MLSSAAYEEHRTRNGAAEIQQPIVVAGWSADKHAPEHLFDQMKAKPERSL